MGGNEVFLAFGKIRGVWSLWILAWCGVLLSYPQELQAQVEQRRPDEPTLHATGPVMVHPLVLDSFSSINLAIQGEVVLREGPLQQIEIHAQQVALEVLNKEVVEGEWVITFSRQLTNYDSVLIIITLPVWERLSVSGRGTIRTETPFTHLQSIRLVAGGTGRICVGGKAETGKINIAGSGWIDARDLAVQQAKVSIAGNGEAFLQVQKLLEVSIVGSGRVTYRGMPEVRANVMGAGVVQMEGSSNN